MKKIAVLLTALMLLLAACGGSSNNNDNNNNKDNNNNNITNEDNNNNDNENNNNEDNNNNDDENNVNNNDENNTNDDEVVQDESLSVHVLQIDQDENVDPEENELYQSVQQAIDLDPNLGTENDMTIYDFDLVQYGDGSVGIMFLLVNRLDKTISDIELVMTFKDEDGTVVFDEEYIELPESYLGQLEPHSVVPVIIMIDEDELESYQELNDDTSIISIDDVSLEYAD